MDCLRVVGWRCGFGTFFFLGVLYVNCPEMEKFNGLEKRCYLCVIWVERKTKGCSGHGLLSVDSVIIWVLQLFYLLKKAIYKIKEWIQWLENTGSILLYCMVQLMLEERPVVVKSQEEVIVRYTFSFSILMMLKWLQFNSMGPKKLPVLIFQRGRAFGVGVEWHEEMYTEYRQVVEVGTFNANFH